MDFFDLPGLQTDVSGLVLEVPRILSVPDGSTVLEILKSVNTVSINTLFVHHQLDVIVDLQFAAFLGLPVEGPYRNIEPDRPSVGVQLSHLLQDLF